MSKLAPTATNALIGFLADAGKRMVRPMLRILHLLQHSKLSASCARVGCDLFNRWSDWLFRYERGQSYATARAHRGLGRAHALTRSFSKHFFDNTIFKRVERSEERR